MQEDKPPSPIYLFVSQSCEHCRELIQLIQQKPELSKRVQGVSVETASKLPDGLTKVPAMFLDGKLTQGKDCFDWVNKFGEIESSPTFSNSGGFEASGYSFLGESEDNAGTGSYSFLGESAGSEGLDMKMINNIKKQEEGGRKSNNMNSDMEVLKNQRMQNMGRK